MIDAKKIQAAAHKHAIENKKKFPHLTIPEFIAGAMLAISQLSEGEDAVKCKKCGSSDLYLGHINGKCNDCGNPL